MKTVFFASDLKMDPFRRRRNRNNRQSRPILTPGDDDGGDCGDCDRGDRRSNARCLKRETTKISFSFIKSIKILDI